jgi:hypothetical protein
MVTLLLFAQGARSSPTSLLKEDVFDENVEGAAGGNWCTSPHVLYVLNGAGTNW